MTQGFSKEPGPEPQLNPTAWPVVWPSQLAGSLRLLEFQASVHQGYIFGCSIRVSAVSPFESFRICPTPSTEDSLQTILCKRNVMYQNVGAQGLKTYFALFRSCPSAVSYSQTRRGFNHGHIKLGAPRPAGLERYAGPTRTEVNKQISAGLFPWWCSYRT